MNDFVNKVLEPTFPHKIYDSRLGNGFYLPDNFREISIVTSHEGEEPVKSFQNLLNSGVKEKRVLEIFTNESLWSFSPVNFDLYDLRFPQDADTLFSLLTPVYDIAQKSLEAINWFGYNDHSSIHMREVCESTLSISNYFNLTESSRNLAFISAAFHDLGNLINRENHSVESCLIAEALISSFKNSIVDSLTIQQAVMLHNSKVYKRFYPDLLEKDFQERVDIISDLYGVVGLVLLISDKIQIGIERLNPKAISFNALQVHMHSLINVLFSTESFKPSFDRNEWEWIIKFDEEKLTDLFDIEPSLLFSKLSNFDENLSFESSVNLFFEYYEALIIRTIDSVFALDILTGNERISSFRFTVSSGEKDKIFVIKKDKWDNPKSFFEGY